MGDQHEPREFNKLMGDANLPTVPRGEIRNIIERDTLQLLGISDKNIETQEPEPDKRKKPDSSTATTEKGKTTSDG